MQAHPSSRGSHRLALRGSDGGMKRTVLVHVSGEDRPGITAGLMRVLAEGGAELADVEQVLVRGRLTLDILIDLPEDQATIKDLLFYAWEHDISVDFEVVEGTPREPASRSVVTVIGARIGPDAFGAVAGAVAAAGGNIDRIFRLSRYPVVSYELAITDGDLAEMRNLLPAVAAEHGVDVAVQAEGLLRRAKRLVVLDVDSTLIQDEMIVLLADEAGVREEVEALTASAMEGEADFEEVLRARVRLLAGLDAAVLETVRSRIRLTPGARTFIRTLKRLGLQVGIVSGGFTVFTDWLREELGLDHAAANTLEVVDGRLTGEVVGPVVDRARKAEILREIATAAGIPLEQTVAVGDGANDVDMLATAGLGIAFNAKAAAREVADTAVSVPYLDAILFLLGIRRDDVDDADRHDGLDAPIPIPGLPDR
jgi:phosphoserine phosphatase